MCGVVDCRDDRSQDNWEYLREQIVTGVVDADVSEVRAGRFGLRYVNVP
jgi:hypothetical protein